MSRPRQAVILAAGSGSRLRHLTSSRPKCLLEVGGRALIHHQIASLRAAGVEQIAVVAGYRADLVQDAIGGEHELIYNGRFAETNSLYSLFLARRWVCGSFILVNGDLLAHPSVYEQVADATGNAFAYDSTSGQHDEHMKVVLDGTRLRAIGKGIPADASHGESLGVLRFGATSVPRLFSLAGTLVAAGCERDWAPAAVDRLARHEVLRAIDVGDLPWTEIDFPEDFEAARDRVWPAICDARRAAAPRRSGRASTARYWLGADEELSEVR